MRLYFTFFAFVLLGTANAQVERDTVLKRCPVFITDTATSNNFFIEGRAVTLKVFRVKGKLTIAFEQKDQFLTFFFHEKRLRSTKYTIEPGSRGKNEVEATYSFKYGDQASYINLSKGTMDVSYDKEKKIWIVKVNGMISNLVDRSVTYYRVKVDFSVI
jgi:hypothetical protein